MKRQRIFRLTVALLLSIIYTLPATPLALAVPPDNDNFANATVIGDLPFSSATDISSATLETGEPTPSCVGANDFHQTVWYAFTATANGSLSASAFGPFPTALSVYTGGSLGSLAEVSCHGFGGLATFPATAGTTYYFQTGSLFGGMGPLQFFLDVTPPPVAGFLFNPFDPSTFDTVQFFNNSYDPGNVGFQTENWRFGDDATATGCCPTHRYAADGNYAVTLMVTTVDGRTSSTTQNVAIVTHDVTITKFTAPNAASAGQTRNIVVGLNSRRYNETVEVRLLKSNPDDPWNPWLTVGTLNQFVPVRPSNRTTDFHFSYTFTSDDAKFGAVTFKAVATITTGRDALPADNEVIAPPTKVGGKIRVANSSNTESIEQGVQIFLSIVVNE